MRAAKCYLMTGSPSLSIDYYRKVLEVEKKNKQALAELELSQNVQRDLEAATLALDGGQFQKVCDSKVGELDADKCLQAIVCMRKCLSEAPHCTLFRSKLAEALVFSKNYDEAQIIAKYTFS